MKKNNRLFYYRLHTKDFLASEDFLLLSLEAKGLLFHCLMSCWANGSLPASPPELARLISAPPEQVNSILPTLLSTFFREKRGRLTCPLLEAERRRTKETSKKNTEAAYERWKEEKKHQDDTCARIADAKQTHCYSEQQQQEEKKHSEHPEHQPPTLPPHEEPTWYSPPAAAAVPEFPTVAQFRLGSSVLEILTGAGIGLTPRDATTFIESGFYRDSCMGNSSRQLEFLKEAVVALQLKITSGKKINSSFGLLKTLYLAIVAEKAGPPRPKNWEDSF